MDDLDIEGVSKKQRPGLIPIAVEDEWSIKPANTNSTSNQSTLSTSETKALDKQREMAGAPMLPPPPQNLPEYDLNLQNLLAPLSNIGSKPFTPKEAEMMIDNMMMQVTTKILSAWVENLRDLQEYQDVSIALKRKNEQVQESIRVNQQQSDVQKQDSNKDGQEFAAYGLLVSAGMIALGIGQGISPTSLISINTVKEIGQVIASIAPTAFDGGIASLVAIFGAGLLTQAAILTLKSGDQNTKSYDYEFAKNYAIRTLQIVAGPEIDKAVGALIRSQNPDIILVKVNLAKIAILAQTLAFSYRLETGSLSGQELAGILKGEIQFQKDDFRNPVVQGLLTQLNAIPQAQRVLVIEKLLLYFDSKPSLDELAAPSHAIRSLFGKVVPPILGG